MKRAVDWSRIAPLAGLVACLPAPAVAQATPGGIQPDPCIPALVIPQSLVDRARAQFAPAGSPAPAAIPPADLAAYRAMETDQRARDWPNLCRFRADNIALLTKPDAGRQVVFMGDSITQNWGFADPGFFTSGVVNRGISGQTTPQMLGRFRADVIALRPKVVHIMAGTNDIAGNTGPTTMADIRNNIMSMVEIAQANNVRVVLASVPPALSFNWMPGAKPAPHVADLNAWIRDYAASRNLVHVDYFAALADASGAMRAELTLDGVHPNGAGYAAMAPLTQTALKTALAQKSQ